MAIILSINKKMANALKPCVLLCGLILFAGSARAVDGPMGVERIARLTPFGYQSPGAPNDNTMQWVQVDLGTDCKIDKVKLFPVTDWGAGSQNFPVRFRIECSNDKDFKTPVLIADNTGADFPDPADTISSFPAVNANGRFVRLTVTRLRNQKYTLSKLEVWSQGKDVAQGKSISDSAGAIHQKPILTRAPRPQGEMDVTDNPGNVIPVNQWKPVLDKIKTPLTGVTLDDGLFKTAMQNNIGYLLNSFTNDEMLRVFRERAGKPVGAGMRKPDPFWDTALAGSNAGRFLMGAGNTLRWMDDAALRKRMNDMIDVIEECRQPDGYVMAYPQNEIFVSERAAYTRSWLTHGLIDAGFSGNKKAFDLLRTNYNWFDHNPYLPELLRRGGQGVQGMIANTRTYFTPVGKPEDLQVIQRYFQENYWLNGLAARDPEAIWKYPYDHPHCYLITSLEPMLDLYRATGAKKYLDASLGGWEMYHNLWEHVGGTIAICEGDSYEPHSYYLHRHTGELCANTFWVKYSQRFHQLYPDQEKYVAEIEKSIYNVGLANQMGSQGIRYHANLVGKKDSGGAINSCCEGQGTRLLSSLPEYIYTLAKDGIYIDLYTGSTIKWKQGGQALQAHMATEFPFSPDVKIAISASRPTQSTLHIRVPAWANADMPVLVNGNRAVTGKPGSYVAITRAWKEGDTLSFKLPMGFKTSLYTGMEQDGRERYALEYGPILMAVLDKEDLKNEANITANPETFTAQLKPMADKPLHFTVGDDARYEYLPYWEVTDQVFTCYPGIGLKGAITVQKVGEGDLALASLGATASSDSEYALEIGCTAKVIDGMIAAPGDFSNRWHSSIETPHPHWVQVKLAKPAAIGSVVIRFADPQGHPTSFKGVAMVNGKEKTLFDVKDYSNWRSYNARFAPVISDTFKLIIRSSANPSYPNAAQVSEIEIYPASGGK